MPENLTLGEGAAVGYLTESVHGAGSPQAQRVTIAHGVDLKKKRAAAKHLCGIPEEREGGETIAGSGIPSGHRSFPEDRL